MNNILKVSFILSLPVLTTLIIGTIKNKLLAVFLGPAGLGALVQINYFLNTANNVSSLGLMQGVTKYVAENQFVNDAYIRLKGILHSTTVIILYVTIPVSLLTILFSQKLSSLLLDNDSSYIFFVIIAVAIPFQVMGQIFISFIQGLKAVKSISIASISISVTGLFFFIPLILFFRINGAVISILILAIINFITFWYVTEKLVKKLTPIREHRTGSFPLSKGTTPFNSPSPIKAFEDKYVKGERGLLYSKELLEFGYLRFIQTSINPLTMLAIRSLIIKHLGVFSNGIYEATVAFSFLYVPIINNILWSYVYPNYCNSKDNALLSKEVNRFLTISLLIAVPMITLIILFCSPLIRLLFSDEFLPAAAVIGIALVGDFLKVLIWPFNVVLMAKDRMKTAVAFEFIWNIFLLVSAFLVIPVYGLKGVFIVQNLSLLLILFLSYIYVNKEFSLSVTKGNILLSIASILIIFTAGGFNPFRQAGGLN